MAGSIVIVKGHVQKFRSPIKSCSMHDHEIGVRELHVIRLRSHSVPFTAYEDDIAKEREVAEGLEAFYIPDRLCLAHRTIDL